MAIFGLFLCCLFCFVFKKVIINEALSTKSRKTVNGTYRIRVRQSELPRLIPWNLTSDVHLGFT